MTMKYPFSKLKGREGWEDHGSLIKRHLFAAWRESKIPLRNKMSTSCPESRGGGELPHSLSWPQFLLASLLRSGQEMASREAASGATSLLLDSKWKWDSWDGGTQNHVSE